MKIYPILCCVPYLENE